MIYNIDYNAFKQIYFDFGSLNDVYWIELTPVEIEQNRCTTSTMPRDEYMNYISTCNRELEIVDRVQLRDFFPHHSMIATFGFMFGPLTSGKYTIRDQNSKIMLASLYLSNVNFTICVIKELTGKYNEDYARAMTVVS